MTAVANSAFTAAQFNAHVRDNLNETAPAKATTAGGIFVASAANSIVERIPAIATVQTSETTTSTTYTDLATAGPSVTATTGAKALVVVSAHLANNTAGANSVMAVDVSGASTIAPSDTRALVYEASVAGDVMQASYITMYSSATASLTAGSNTFTAKYRVGLGTGTFQFRYLLVIPL